MVPCGAPDRPISILNGTGADGLVLELSAVPRKAAAFDARGRAVGLASYPGAGLSRVAVPAGGYLRLD